MLPGEDLLQTVVSLKGLPLVDLLKLGVAGTSGGGGASTLCMSFSAITATDVRIFSF